MTNRELATSATRPYRITTDVREPKGNFPLFPSPAIDMPAEERPSLFFTVIRKRWWVLGAIAIISGLLSYFVAKEFRSVNSQIEGSLIYTGLPTPPGPTVYRPPSLHTFKEVLLSAKNEGISKILNTYQLSISPDHFAELFDAKVLGRSSIMQLTFNWPEPQEGVDILNDTMLAVIEAARTERQHVLDEHIRHVIGIENLADEEYREALNNLNLARKQYEDELSRNGLDTERYSDALKRVSDTDAAIDSKTIELEHITQRISLAEQRRLEQVALYQSELVKQRQLQLDLAMKQYNEKSSQFRDLANLKDEFAAVDTSGKTESLLEWEAALGRIGLATLGPLREIVTAEISAVKTSIDSSDRRIEELRLQQASMESHLGLLRKRVADYREKLSQEENNTNLPSSATVADLEAKLDAVNKRRELYAQQLDNMNQLRNCEATEFSQLVKPSVDTVVVTSNAKKLFAMSFFACCVLLTAPVFLVDWMLEREAPVETFAKRWNVPLMTERAVAQSRSRRHAAANGVESEPIRMAALRIQQSLLQNSSIVLVSGLGDSMVPANLLNCLSECLANRGERVLLVDAVDHHQSGGPAKQPLSDLVENTASPNAQSTTETAGTKLKTKSSRGLCDIFSAAPPDVADMIQHTQNPCVDVITSGDAMFPAEAMASERLTQLLMDCQRSYSLIFVAGPPVSRRADFQMLAARADAIVLTGDNRSVKQPSSPAAIRDLIELQAPVIGMMA